jgi:hypothetical protein
VPIALILFGELVRSDSAGDFGPLAVGSALNMISPTLIKASVSPPEMRIAFLKVRPVLNRESDESGDSGAVLVEDLLNLRKILCNELPRPAHSAKWAKEMLLTGVSFNEAGFFDRKIFVKHKVRGAVLEVGENLFDIGAFFGITLSINILRHVHGPCFTGAVIVYNVHVSSFNPVGVGAPMIGVFLSV